MKKTGMRGMFCYITTKMAELEQEITLIGDSGDPQITMWISNDDYLNLRRGKILLQINIWKYFALTYVDKQFKLKSSTYRDQEADDIF